MRIIPVPTTAYESQEVIIAGKTYNLLFKFNTSDEAWYITIRNTNLEPLVSGIKVMPNQNLTKAYDYLNIFNDGDLWCIRNNATTESVTRDNFGAGLSYELLWISSQEAIQGGVSDVIQL